MSREILKEYKIKAKKALGQNFLVNEKIVQKIAESIHVPGENIIEVGPGYGALTEKLLDQKPKSLNLVELDRDMIAILESRIEKEELKTGGIDFHINCRDILKYEPTENPYSVIANIPYYITSPILRHFLYNVENKPEKMVILMQEDVGDKILGKGNNKSSVLSLFIEKKASVHQVMRVPKENFVPAPKIESAVLLFESHDRYNDVDDTDFLKIIKIGFSAPRKKLLNNLMKGGYEKVKLLSLFRQLGLGENSRGEDLGIDKWIELLENVK